MQAEAPNADTADQWVIVYGFKARFSVCAGLCQECRPMKGVQPCGLGVPLLAPHDKSSGFTRTTHLSHMDTGW